MRGVQGNFFPGIKIQAMKMAVGEGMEIVQNFDPLPLYEVISFLKEHGKFKPTNDGFTADAGKVCEHE